jgi:hypothetical protein
MDDPVPDEQPARSTATSAKTAADHIVASCTRSLSLTTLDTVSRFRSPRFDSPGPRSSREASRSHGREGSRVGLGVTPGRSWEPGR